MAEHWNGGNGGKGCKPRPFSVTQHEYDNRWDAIFNKDKKQEDNTDVSKNDYQDILSTEDCLTDDKE
jgi:hypothetical protein